MTEDVNPDEGTEYCDACAQIGRWIEADYVSTDFDRLCYPCGRELHAPVLYYLLTESHGTDPDA